MPHRIFHRKTYRRGKAKWLIRILKFFVIAFFSLILITAAGIVAVFLYYAKDLPRPEKFAEKTFSQSTQIYDRTGKVLLYELYGDEKREIIPLSAMPDYFKKAVVATEDAKFYSHHGLDFKAVGRSILADLKLGKAAYGASTISQQLIRSTFLTTEKTLRRKIREVILTLELERRYQKDQILEWYLNQVPFSANIYGVQVASKSFFNKEAKDLSLAESALLAAVIRSPVYLSPLGEHKQELLDRKDYVLDRMVQENFITKDQAEIAKKEGLKFSEIMQPIKAPHFVFYVQDYLIKKYGEEYLENGGLKVYTSLDWDMQEKAEKIVADGVKKNRAANSYNAALVAIDPKTGEILSMVGSADWFGDPLPKGCTPGADCLFDPKVNVATYNIGRQPGSSFKPFVYATAFEKGYNDKTIVVDELTDFGIWGGKSYIPQNYDGLFRGPVTLRSALAQSLNVPSVKVLAYLAGQHDSIETAKKMGITTLAQPDSYYGLSLVLGGGEVKLLDMVSAYGVFATEGLRYPAIPVLKIEDSQGNVIEENKKTPKRVLSPETCRLISDILSDNNARSPIFGLHSSLYFDNYQVAAKTGTTTDYKDGWNIGYTPSIVAGVWAGNSDNTSINRKTGAMIASPIWHEFMAAVLLKYPKEYFNKPDNASPTSPTPSPTPALSP